MFVKGIPKAIDIGYCRLVLLKYVLADKQQIASKYLVFRDKPRKTSVRVFRGFFRCLANVKPTIKRKISKSE
ncbi:hypothetical protein SEA_CIRCINUS_190 [Streptomyces phage Circinus]|uniref:Uncharacterized protein n=1 Tax=Streptomyces phage Circinus TaxID=2562189 RepID=A0A4D6E1R7_9CAUD|nr:hypothetical protein SEA_CIRCINUS_190 [Streptomyces phage Circinus]